MAKLNPTTDLRPIRDTIKQDPPHARGVAPLRVALSRVKQQLLQLDRLGRAGRITDQHEVDFFGSFRQLSEQLNRVMYPAGAEPPPPDLAAQVQAELLPYVLLTRTIERIYSKPRGYAGDSRTIEWIYSGEAGGASRVGRLVDQAFLREPAAQAVRNRRQLMADEIRAVLRKHPDQAVRVTSLACGPAVELFDVFDGMEHPRRLQVTLLDMDPKALASLQQRVTQRGLQRCVTLKQTNLIHLATGRDCLELAPQHLIYSVGLIDYLDDRLVRLLLNLVHRHLLPGGACIVGNFRPRHSSQALMDVVLDWKLNYRTALQLNSLFRRSAFTAPCDEIFTEPAGVNLFAKGVRR